MTTIAERLRAVDASYAEEWPVATEERCQMGADALDAAEKALEEIANVIVTLAPCPDKDDWDWKHRNIARVALVKLRGTK